MEDMDKNRRAFVRTLGLSVLGLAAASRAMAAAPVCYDPATLPLSQKNRRRGLGYVEPSADPKKHCGACAFFKGTQTGCGTCEMLSGGAVMASAVCNSFAPKAT
jgi:hypothetical protein